MSPTIDPPCFCHTSDVPGACCAKCRPDIFGIGSGIKIDWNASPPIQLDIQGRAVLVADADQLEAIAKVVRAARAAQEQGET